MARSLRALLLGLLLAPAAGPAAAIPMLEFVFLDSGATVSPTQTVVMRGRITNVGSEALEGGVGQGSITIPTAIVDQYFDPANPIVLSAPAGVTDLAPGESIDWQIASFAAFPVGGNLGDPVPPGAYVFPVANITPEFFVALGPNSFTVEVDTSGAADFRWTVVPEPAGWLWVTGGLGVLLYRRSRAARKTR